MFFYVIQSVLGLMQGQTQHQHVYVRVRTYTAPKLCMHVCVHLCELRSIYSVWLLFQITKLKEHSTCIPTATFLPQWTSPGMTCIAIDFARLHCALKNKIISFRRRK